jgi:hypothetical protein
MVNNSFTKSFKLVAFQRSRGALDEMGRRHRPSKHYPHYIRREPGGSPRAAPRRDGKCIAPETSSEMPAPLEEVRRWIGTAGRGLSDVGTRSTTLIVEMVRELPGQFQTVVLPRKGHVPLVHKRSPSFILNIQKKNKKSQGSLQSLPPMTLLAVLAQLKCLSRSRTFVA